jgi:HK97 gp10 family phage protein
VISISTTLRFTEDLPQITRRQAWQLVVAATNIVRARAVQLVSTPAKRIRKKRTRTTSKGKKGSQYTVFVGSRPGQPPQVRRGFGRKNIDVEVYPSQLYARLGVRKNAAYMAYLEVGTGRIQARPWLVRALEETKSALQALRLP